MSTYTYYISFLFSVQASIHAMDTIAYYKAQAVAQRIVTTAGANAALYATHNQPAAVNHFSQHSTQVKLCCHPIWLMFVMLHFLEVF